MAGGGALKQGRNGKDLVLTVPCGTLVKDARTKEVLLDLTEDGQEWVICKGGRGGKGNNCFKSPTNQAPNICTEGTAGESKEIELELKLIADIGLVGMPNAGKSTLLSTLSHVPLKIAAYPFTTLTPNLSFIQAEDYSRLLIADIPGIIEDAHNNRGLGIAFLKHVERSFVLVYVIDIAAFEGRDPIEDFRILRDEIKAYREDLMDKPFIVALNKTDVEGADEQIARFRTHYPFPPQQFFEISALTGQGLPLLVEGMRSLVKEPQALDLIAKATP
jgi:GTP-binding protein